MFDPKALICDVECKQESVKLAFEETLKTIERLFENNKISHEGANQAAAIAKQLAFGEIRKISEDAQALLAKSFLGK